VKVTDIGVEILKDAREAAASYLQFGRLYSIRIGNQTQIRPRSVPLRILPSSHGPSMSISGYIIDPGF
jgi:hypothetical protein